MRSEVGVVYDGCRGGCEGGAAAMAVTGGVVVCRMW
ncbi:hypothetical protein Tco_1251773, partial [Tanacetum coccineum]